MSSMDSLVIICAALLHKLKIFASRTKPDALPMVSVAQQFFLLLCCLDFARVSTQEMSRCDFQPVNFPKDALLTCHFPEDLSVSKKGFTVYHYVERGSPEAVVECWWANGGLECFAKLGFEYNKTVNTIMKVAIRNVTSALTGTYACQVDRYGSSVLGKCQLDLKLGQNNTCNFSKAPNDSQITLTCFFNEDVQETQRNFSVYSYTGQEKLGVLNCWWENEKVNCQVNEGYRYNKEVSSSLRLGIPQPTNEKTEIYSCWHGGSTADQVNTCSLNGEETEQNPITHLIIGISLGILAAVVLLIITIVVVKRLRAHAGTKGTPGDEENHLLKPIKKKSDQVTETFKDFLLKKTKEMYPNVHDECYFVPPVYLNKLRYKTQLVAGQVVYIPDPPDPSDERRDRAMQHVIHSLRHMADTQQEHMFVLTQFQYEDYLNNPGRYYRKHRLPVPSGLKEKNKYKDIGCFDFLIIHRHYGVLVGVVKTVDEKESGNQDSKQRIEDSRGQGRTGKETNSCKTKRKTDCKVSGESKQKTEDSGSRKIDQVTFHTESQDNEQYTVDLKSQDIQKKTEDDENRDDKTKTKDKDHVSDNTVKTTQDKTNSDNREELVVKEVSEAIRQFRKADCMIKHLLSDQEQTPTVRLTLILPNITSDTLLSALNSDPELTQNFLECIQQKSINDPIQLCLCADHLPNTDTTRNVESVTNYLKTYWDQYKDSSVVKLAMTNELYQTIIARFCGPSTLSYFESPYELKAIQYQLPKTLDQAVSLTGDLFERFTLHPGLTDLLNEPQVFFVGPPGTGKTRMLSLVGRKWLSEGHEVYVLYTSPEGAATSMELQTLLQQTSLTQSQAIPSPTVIALLCNIDDDNKIDNTIKLLKDRLKEKPLFALVDELTPEKEKAEQVGVFLKTINDCLKDSRLWVTSYRADISPPGWKGKFLQKPISCPPSIVRETGQGLRSLGLSDYLTSKCFSPTDGLPVKHIFHHDLHHSKKEPRDCGVCGEEVAKFLTQDLHVADRVSDSLPTASNTTRDQRTCVRPVTLQYRDVMILFESDLTEDVPMMTSLKDKGIPAQIISCRNEKITLRHESNTVLVAKAGFLNGLKRKVFVYVEGDINRSDFSAQWNRLRGITSCTSQLVYVHSSN